MLINLNFLKNGIDFSQPHIYNGGIKGVEDETMYRPATFAERLKTALEIKDMTKAELSRLTGISRSSLTRYAKGDWEGKQDAVYAIAKALNLNEAWLMGYDAPMDRIDMDAFLEAASKTAAEDDDFLQRHSGLILSSNSSFDIGCSIHCRDQGELKIVQSILMSVAQLQIAERTEKLAALQGVVSALQHMPTERSQELLNYANFLSQG